MSIFCCRRGGPSPGTPEPTEAWAYSFFIHADSLPIKDNVTWMNVSPSSVSHMPFSVSSLEEFNDGYSMGMTYLGYEIPDDIGAVISAEWSGEYDFGAGLAPFDTAHKLDYMGEAEPNESDIWSQGIATAIASFSIPKDTPGRTPFSHQLSNLDQIKPGRTIFLRVSPYDWDDPTADPGLSFLRLLSPRPPGPTPPGFNFPPGPVLVLTTSTGTVTVATKNTPPPFGGV